MENKTGNRAGWYTRFIPYVGLSVFRETAFCRMLGVAHPSLMVLVALVMVAVVWRHPLSELFRLKERPQRATGSWKSPRQNFHTAVHCIPAAIMCWISFRLLLLIVHCSSASFTFLLPDCWKGSVIVKQNSTGSLREVIEKSSLKVTPPKKIKKINNN